MYSNVTRQHMGDPVIVPAVPYTFPSIGVSGCCAADVWKAATSFTVVLASGGTQINPLVQQDIGFELRSLLRIDNVYPQVFVRTLPHVGIGTPYIYFVDITYPMYVEGRRILPDGTVCDDVIPIAIPQVQAQGQAVMDRANACLVTNTSTDCTWRQRLITAANFDLGLDSVTELKFKPFIINPTLEVCTPKRLPAPPFRGGKGRR